MCALLSAATHKVLVIFASPSSGRVRDTPPADGAPCQPTLSPMTSRTRPTVLVLLVLPWKVRVEDAAQEALVERHGHGKKAFLVVVIVAVARTGGSGGRGGGGAEAHERRQQQLLFPSTSSASSSSTSSSRLRRLFRGGCGQVDGLLDVGHEGAHRGARAAQNAAASAGDQASFASSRSSSADGS